MGISIWQLVIVLGIVILLFGTKKLRNVGGDLGNAIKSFKKAVKTGEDSVDEKNTNDQIAQKEDGRVIDAEVTKEKDDSKS
ncbi:MAG: Sec-independent protein translocase subunit TatA [Gammaproteobacteria bacterium]|nr:Sec-independent protein translocase subunit TatA [Gammaproteobacteria bacterium]